jgi:hypothetical protein
VTPTSEIFGWIFHFHEIGKYAAEVIGFVGFSAIFHRNVSDIWVGAIIENLDGLAVLVVFPVVRHDCIIRSFGCNILFDRRPN